MSESGNRKIRLGMIGGGTGAFIGYVHRIASRLDGDYDLVAGALSSRPEVARESGKNIGLAPDRIYTSYEEMAAKERRIKELESKLEEVIGKQQQQQQQQQQSQSQRGGHGNVVPAPASLLLGLLGLPGLYLAYRGRRGRVVAETAPEMSPDEPQV